MFERRFRLKKEYLETGRIVGTHGICGEMRVQPWSDSPDALTGLKKLYLDARGVEHLTAARARAHKNIVLLEACGVDSIEKAERLRGRTLYVRRGDLSLPEGSHFVQDLIGCAVADADTGKAYGVLTGVSATGANDVWHIRAPDGEEYLIPAIPDVVRHVDTDAEMIQITPLKGIFDDED